MRFAACSVIILLLASSALAVPALQLYTPDGSYNTATETWMTKTREFSLWVAWASHNENYVSASDLRLDIAVLSPVVPGSSLTITGPGYESGLVITDFEIGTPDIVSPHGIYPANYFSLPLPEMTLAAADDAVRDYVSGEGADRGMIYEYQIELHNVKDVHFDLTAQMLTEKGFIRDSFAPYSHDAGAHYGGFDPEDEGGGTPVPESPVLFTAGLLAVAFFRKRR